MKRLAAEAGIDPSDNKAVRRFEKKREGRKTSNQDSQNPHDPEAKVGRTKDGACDMTYSRAQRDSPPIFSKLTAGNPEHVSDLESGAIVTAQVRPGDAADNDGSLCGRIEKAVITPGEVAPETPVEKLGSELCADEGYFAIKQVARLQACGVRTVIADPQAGRRKPHNASEEHRAALRRARRATKSASGKALLRKRDEHLEQRLRLAIGEKMEPLSRCARRCHGLDHGGLRRAASLCRAPSGL